MFGAVFTRSLHASCLIVKRPGVNALRNAFETDINQIVQTTSEGGLDQTAHV